MEWGFKTEGIDVVMPTGDLPGTWTGWWEGVVDLVPPKGGGSRAFSINSLFKKNLPRPFPLAASSTLRVITTVGLEIDTAPEKTSSQWLDGQRRQVVEWDLTKAETADKDIKFSFKGEGDFEHRAFASPNSTNPQLSDSTPLQSLSHASRLTARLRTPRSSWSSLTMPTSTARPSTRRSGRGGSRGG